MIRTIWALALTLVASPLLAHDTWIEVNPSVVRTGDVAHVDLKLGNHGNEHRDFKLASKISPEGWSLDVIGPSGKSVDLKDGLIDTGYSPKEGYWTNRLVLSEPGLHVVSHQLDKLHGKTRAIKSGKSYVLSSPSLDQLGDGMGDISKALGHAIELVPLVDPVVGVAPGSPIRVRLLFEGRPRAGATVTFIPRGQALATGTDPDFERTTDDKGEASFTPKDGNWVLVVVHHAEPERKGEGYDKTHYTATLTFNVPQVSRGTKAGGLSKAD